MNNTQKHILTKVKDAIAIIENHPHSGGVRCPIGKIELPYGKTAYIQVDIFTNQWIKEGLLKDYNLSEEELFNIVPEELLPNVLTEQSRNPTNNSCNPEMKRMETEMFNQPLGIWGKP